MSGATAEMLIVLRQRVLKGWQSGESMDKLINQLSLSLAFEEDIQWLLSHGLIGVGKQRHLSINGRNDS